ncbi:hypothetical protein GIB67_037269 [Kingdonia uniflora]|uniref:Histone deacetylase complex subunit SAP30 Sin3 binding domain-containing protein n=1 Tax=Kingdonia uniflora TaxID=39325 RepID=A0A7J7MS35_9MAGN|nr:hypothetical protein GIB67_037269 [Kingdonia uniflora]
MIFRVCLVLLMPFLVRTMESTVVKVKLEPEICSSTVFSPYRDDSGDEELSVLPRHTKVVVTGNNRTKSVLVGLQGVVKKAVGLGGWHWLVLKNGDEVKLQRNALSVLEHPTGNEVDDDNEFDNSCTSSDEKDNDLSSSSEFHKRSKPRVRHTRRPWISSVKSMCRTEIQSNVQKPKLKVNLARLGTISLWRYSRHYNLVSNGDTNLSREQMLKFVKRHFLSQKLDEIEVIMRFIGAAAKRSMETRKTH